MKTIEKSNREIINLLMELDEESTIALLSVVKAILAIARRAEHRDGGAIGTEGQSNLIDFSDLVERSKKRI